jgi:hypothetical protein
MFLANQTLLEVLRSTNPVMAYVLGVAKKIGRRKGRYDLQVDILP